MPKKAAVKYRSLRSNLVHLPLSLFASLAQQQARPQGLILHLTPLISPSSSSRPARAAYLGWSGLAAASSLASIGGGEAETVEVDPEVAIALGWAEGTIVEISIIHNPVRAKSVSVTPLTSDDWEILEQHASFLENNLLSQLRAAQAGQVIDAWVAGKSKIRIRVDQTNPSTSASSAVLVNPDTKIYVAPRPRSSSSKTPSETVITPAQTVAGSKGKEKGKEKAVEVRVVPQRIAAQWGQPPAGKGDPEVVGWVCSDTLETAGKKLGVKGDFLPVRMQRRKRDAGAQGELNAVDVAKDGDQAGGQAENGDGPVYLWLGEWEGVPEGCVVLQGAEKWENDWACVDLYVGSQKRKGTKSSTAKHRPLTSPSLMPPLAGISTLLDDALRFFRLQDGSACRPLLLTGGKGSGKTSLARRIASYLEQDVAVMAEEIYIDVARLDAERRVDKVKEEINSWLEQAKGKTPCLLVLDGLDSLIGPENELSSSSDPQILAEHFCRLIKDIPPGILVLVTAVAASSLHPLLNSKHVFGDALKISPPTKEVRQEVRAHPSLADGRCSAESGESALDFVTLGSMTEGYSAADLIDLVGSATQQAMIRSARSGDSQQSIRLQDFVDAQIAFTPLSLRGVSLQKSDVKWSDIGAGLTETRRVLRETLEWPTKYARIFANCPLRLRSGLLLYGYPGCGKTLLASAVAKECGLNFISVKGPEILNKYIGASEKSVRDLFERATAAKPCVLFFDEFDSIAPKRGHDSTGVTDRVVNQMLTEMDGAQGLEGVYVLAATSRPDLIDPALLRPGRLDKSLLCDMPDQAERLDILVALSRKMEVAATVDMEAISFDTDGFSGADLQAMMYNAHLEVIHAQIDGAAGAKGRGQANGSSGDGGKGKGKEKGKGKGKGKGKAVDGEAGETITTIIKNSSSVQVDTDSGHLHTATAAKPVIEQVHLLRSLANTRPSVPLKEKAKLQHIYRAFMSDRDGKMANGDTGRDTGTRVSLQ
ncbi:putative peroxisome biosynthesis protein PAS1 [Dioszegia hungarica]|uniref:Peroxisomal ATPase PEX1 n=1 Tax=Dioszegia hungarica TaxID=4972 RepID=A0AA38GZP6_9TREE|nr:putative peroxisome biosynthesis protein PAS1 [Dioszegia hungarica]KAI9631847.1 putative peroxisome biosynthesis protein PAS1 [Dioszegia hungarica]